MNSLQRHQLQDNIVYAKYILMKNSTKKQKLKNSVRKQCKFCGKTIINERNKAFCNYNCWQLSFWCTEKITRETLNNFFAEINLFSNKRKIKYPNTELLLNLKRILLISRFNF